MHSKCRSLQLGQRVDLADDERGFKILVSPTGARQIVGLGGDYIVLEESIEGVRTRIPQHLILEVSCVEVASAA